MWSGSTDHLDVLDLITPVMIQCVESRETTGAPPGSVQVDQRATRRRDNRRPLLLSFHYGETLMSITVAVYRGGKLGEVPPSLKICLRCAFRYLKNNHFPNLVITLTLTLTPVTPTEQLFDYSD